MDRLEGFEQVERVEPRKLVRNGDGPRLTALDVLKYPFGLVSGSPRFLAVEVVGQCQARNIRREGR